MPIAIKILLSVFSYIIAVGLAVLFMIVANIKGKNDEHCTAKTIPPLPQD